MTELIKIYTLAHPVTGEVRYVGKSNNPKKRYANHICNKKNTHTTNWIKSLRKQGLLPVMEVLDCCVYENWQETEIYWIDQLRQWGFNLTNHTSGGGGDNSLALKSKPTWNKGLKTPEEVKLKMSKSQKEKDQSWKIGRKQSKETVEKRVSKCRGENNGNSKLSNDQVYTIRNSNLTGVELANIYKVTPTTITKIRKRKSYASV